MYSSSSVVCLIHPCLHKNDKVSTVFINFLPPALVFYLHASVIKILPGNTANCSPVVWKISLELSSSPFVLERELFFFLNSKSLWNLAPTSASICSCSFQLTKTMTHLPYLLSVPCLIVLCSLGHGTFSLFLFEY